MFYEKSWVDFLKSFSKTVLSSGYEPINAKPESKLIRYKMREGSFFKFWFRLPYIVTTLLSKPAIRVHPKSVDESCPRSANYFWSNFF